MEPIDLARWRRIGEAAATYSKEQLAPVLTQALQELFDAEQEIARLRRYARHLPTCAPGLPCSCGLGDDHE